MCQEKNVKISSFLGGTSPADFSTAGDAPPPPAPPRFRRPYSKFTSRYPNTDCCHLDSQNKLPCVFDDGIFFKACQRLFGDLNASFHLAAFLNDVGSPSFDLGYGRI